MDEQLQELLRQAKANGADRAELVTIAQDYLAQKKKEEISPLQSVLEADSTASVSSTTLDGEQRSSLADLLSRPQINDVVISQDEADFLQAYATQFDSAYQQTIYDRFDVGEFESLVGDLSISQVPQLDANLEASAATVYKPFLDSYNRSNTPEEKEAAKESLFDYLMEQGDPDYEINRLVLGTTTNEVGQNLRGNRFKDEDAEGILTPIPLSDDVSLALQDLGGGAAMTSGASLRESLPEDIKNDPQKVSDYERHLFDQYNIAVDLNGDKYIGGLEVLNRGFGAGFGASVTKAWRETMAGGDFILGDAVASVFGEDNWFTQWAVRSGEEGNRLAEEISKNLPIPLERIAAKTDRVMPGIAKNFFGTGSQSDAEDAADFDDLINDYLRMGGESVPMMTGAIAAGLATRGRARRITGLRNLRGLTGSARIAEARKILDGGKTAAQIKSRVSTAQQTGAFAASSVLGMGTSYNAVRDEEWFQEMSGAEKAAYTSIMGVAEGAPAFVAANISMRAVAAMGNAGKKGFIMGALKATGLGMLEEGVTEGVTAGVQYLTNVAFNPNQKYDANELLAAVKDGMYAGVFLGGAVAGVAQAPGGIYAGAMAATSLPGVRDRIIIKALEKEYDSEADLEKRKEIGQKLADAVMKSEQRKLNRRKFYEDLAENNPEAWEQLTGLQKSILKAGLQFERAKDPETRDKLKQEMMGLMEQRSEIENELGMEYTLDVQKEFSALSGRIAEIDKFYGYGDLFQEGSDSTTVTGDNASQVLKAIEDALFVRVDRGEAMIGGFITGAQMKRSLKNVIRVAQALSKAEGFKGVTIHRTSQSFREATGEEAARGMWHKQGDIHIFAPMAMENTAFHEAFHDLLLQNLGADAVKALAKELYKGTSGDLRVKYNNFLSAYGNVGRNAGKLFDDNAGLAEEFLAEALGDLTEGTTDIKVKRGMLNSFKNLVGTTLNAIPGVEVDLQDVNPRLQDLVTAIQKTTGQLAEGQEVSGIKDVAEAAKKRGYAVMSMEVEDMNKQQGIEARLRDVEEVTSPAQYADAMAAAIARMNEKGMKMALQVTALSEEDVQEIVDGGGKLFMTKDGLAGAYVDGNGYMGGLFKNPDSEFKAVSIPLQSIREQNGGKFYDAFATKLEDIYIGNGWKPVVRLDFDEQYAPEGWNDPDSPLKDKPDVVFFVKGEGVKGEGIRMSDYDNAKKYVSDLANNKPQQIIPELRDRVGVEPFFERFNINQDELNKLKEEMLLPQSQRQKRNPKVVEALKQYLAQEITQDAYIEMVRREMPIVPMRAVPEIPTMLEIATALTSNKLAKGLVGETKQLPDNYPVALRLDIPAYDNYDVWVVSVHEGTSSALPVAYAQTGLIKDVRFDRMADSDLNIAINIGVNLNVVKDRATGKEKVKKDSMGKTPFAKMYGSWQNHSSEDLRERAVQIMEGDQYNMSEQPTGKLEGWVQVGMNPFRHSFFYDKRDGNPVVSASEVIQVGALVLAKDVEKVLPSDERYLTIRPDGTPIKYQFAIPGQVGSNTEQTFSNKAQKFGRMSNRYAAEDEEFRKGFDKVMHNADFDEVLSGRRMITSAPDHMLVGQVMFDEEVIAEGGGGLFYPIRTGNSWAFAQKSDAEVFVRKVNALRAESPDGKVFIGLISGSDTKVLSNVTTLQAAQGLFQKLVDEKVITEAQRNRLFVDAFNDTVEKSVDKKTGKRKLGDPIPRSRSSEADYNEAISRMNSMDKTSFELRSKTMGKVFALLGKMKSVRDNPTKLEKVRAISDTPRITRGQVGSSLKYNLIKAMTEGVLQGIEKDLVYAAIEVDSDLSVDMMEGNEAFPAAVTMRDASGAKKTPVMHVFKDKPHVNEALRDKEFNLTRADFVEYALENKLYEKDDKGKVRNESQQRNAADSAWRGNLGMTQAPYGVGVGRPKAQAVAQTEAKAQGSLLRLVSQMIDAKYPSPKILKDYRKKNPVTGIEESAQLDAFVYVKKEVIKTLMEYGMNADAAEDLFQRAVAYKKGRIQGKKEGMRVAAKQALQTRKMTTVAKNLKKDLETLRDKSKTFEEFLGKAIELINERMKENSKTPFTAGQVTRLVKYVRQAHKTSGKKVKEQGLDSMQSFIDKISNIFDERDTKAAMQRYLDGIEHARKLQKRLKRMGKVRGRGQALKSTATYGKVARGLSDVNPALLPQNELEGFISTLMETVQSMSKTKVVFDKDLQQYVGVAPAKTEVSTLYNALSNYQAMEELGRQSLFMARAQRRAAKNKTDVMDEYNAIVKAYERSRLSPSRRAILDFIDSNPTLVDDEGNTVVLDSGNPAHVELITKRLAEAAADKDTLQKETIINDVLLPRIVANIDKLLEDSQIADILGIYDVSDLNFDKLRDRLARLDRHQVINLDYKLDDYIVNDSLYGIGYLHSIVKGQLDMPTKLGRLFKKGNIRVSKRVSLGLMDTLESFLRNSLITDNKTFAKLRNVLGLTGMETAFARADFIHSQIVEDLQNKIKEIEDGGGSVTTRFDRAVMQVYSMLKQMPEFQGEQRDAEALWYLEVRNAMNRTIEYYEREETFTPNEIKELREAMDYVFGSTADLAEAVAKVESDRGDLVDMVKWFADAHAAMLPQFNNYVERYLGKQLVVEDNYTAFEVIPATGARSVDDLLSLRVKMQNELMNSSLSQSKKVAGSSFERNPRSLKGEARIGLDFLGINERTIRDNVILSNTVGDIMTMSHILNSDQLKSVMPDRLRKELERKAMQYVKQDHSQVPSIFSAETRIAGVRMPNPLNTLRMAVVLKSFGGFLLQIPKQATVLTSVAFQSKNPIQAIPYLVENVLSMAYYAVTNLRGDSKLALEDGKYKLLQNSPVFQRDYESGNIDPFTGRMDFDTLGFTKVQRFLSDVSLKALKETDKVAAIASWFTYYGDVLISSGAVDSYSDIDWDSEALEPNQEALSYANTMVAKDQAASTPRQAADIYSDGKGPKAAVAWAMRNILLPFSRTYREQEAGCLCRRNQGALRKPC